MEVPGVLNAQRSTAMPERVRPWSAISFLSRARLALVGCDAGLGCGPKLPSSTPSYPRSWSLCRMTWKSLVGCSWLNRYAQVPIEMRALAMIRGPRGKNGRGLPVIRGEAPGNAAGPVTDLDSGP